MTSPTSDSLGLQGADAAMQRAAEDARRIAAQTGTPLAIWRDGRVITIPVPPPPTAPTMPPSTTR